MRLYATADLHYDIQRSRQPAQQLAGQLLELAGDYSGSQAMVLVGDSAGAQLQHLRDCLRLFADFPGRKFMVPGNHCLWCAAQENSLDRYERIIPQVAGEEGFEVLDHSPAVVAGVGLAGSIGWYDYSFRDESLGIPEDFYRAKVAPGAANYLQEHRWLIEEHHAALSERHLGMGARWMDGVHVRLGMSDEEFCDMLAGRLRRQLAELSTRCERIVACVHHLPFPQLVPPDRPERFAFAAAYMGSAAIGAAISEFPKVSHVLCGHSHWPDRRRVGRIEVINIGSTYVQKRLEILEFEGD